MTEDEIQAETAEIGKRLTEWGWSLVEMTKSGQWLLARNVAHPDVELESYSSSGGCGVVIRRPDASLQLRGKAIERLEFEVSELFRVASNVVPNGVVVMRASVLTAVNARSKAVVHRRYFKREVAETI